MKIDDDNIAYLDTGDVLTTEQSKKLIEMSKNCNSLFGEMRDLNEEENKLYHDMLKRNSVKTGFKFSDLLDDYTWDGSGD